MKTNVMTATASRRHSRRRPFLALLQVLVALPVLASPEADAPPKDHALFVGTTLQIEDSGTYSELVAASRHTLTILADGRVRNIPRHSVAKVRIEPGLRISNVVANIDKLATRVVKADSHGDRWAADRMQILLNSMQAQAYDIQDGSQRLMGELQRQAAVAPTAEAAAAARNALDAAIINDQVIQSNNTRLNTSVSSIQPNGNPANALEVTCELASPKVAQNAYALVVTEYRTNSREKPQYKVHVEPLRRLGPKPEPVTMVQGDLPVGFILGRVDVHVYADGQELATNLSEQRVDLTADDALRYLVLCYVTAHPKDTLPATPLKIALPAGFKQQISPEQFDRTLYATVGTDGTVQGLSAAPDQIVATDPSIDAVVRKFRYNPALKEGKPIESVVALKLADYVR